MIDREGNERRDNSAMIRLTTLPADLTHEQLAGLQTASYGHQIVITTMSNQVIPCTVKRNCRLSSVRNFTVTVRILRADWVLLIVDESIDHKPCAMFKKSTQSTFS